MPTAADIQKAPDGSLLNPQDFTPGQLGDFVKSGQLNYQNFMAALPNAAKPANNAADLAAQQAAANPVSTGDLRFGTNAQGQVNNPGAAAAAAQAQPPATPTALATATQGGAPGVAQMQGGPPLIPYGAGAAPQTRPAGYSPADRWVNEARGAVNENQELHDTEAIQHQRELAKAVADDAENTSIDLKLAQQKYQQDEQEAARHRAELAAEAKDSHAKIQSELAEQEAKGIDPNHWWQSQSTGSKILAGIAVGLGAFAAHPLGPHGVASENTALGIINGAISADIDAQKANLQHGIEVARMRGALNETDFNHREALLKAEQESIQSGYSIAMNDITKRAALYGQNAEVQQKAAAMISGLQQSMDERVGKVIEQRYALMKNAERPVAVPGAGGIDWKEVRKRMEEIENKAAEAGKDIPPAEAQRRALIDVTGRDIAAGTPVASYAKEPKQPAGAKNAAAAEEARQAILRNGRELQELNKKAGYLGLTHLNPVDYARAIQLQTQIALDYNRAHGINRIGAEAEQARLEHKVVPNLTEVGSPAAREARLQGLEKEFGHSGTGAAEPEEEEPEKD